MIKDNKNPKYAKLYSQNTLQIDNVSSNDKFKFYKLEKTGQIICEYFLEVGLKNGEINIAQITDVHLNYCLEDELEDEEVNYTKKCRTWLADGESVISLKKAMDVASYFDQTVFTGDILDYLSNGAKILVQKHIFEQDPEVICTIGSHDITKQMQTGLENKLSEEKRFGIIQDFWIHNIYYTSKIINDEVIIVGLNTAFNKYYPSQIEKLMYDIEYARKEDKYILIFQHDPICTGNPDDIDVKPMLSVSLSNSKHRNFYDGCIGNLSDNNMATREIYQLITNSADVIKGIFCGHFHSCFYTEVKAFDKKGVQTVIPQINALGNPYFDRVGVLTRIIIE